MAREVGMKKAKFTVEFYRGSPDFPAKVVIFAFTVQEARILAQAQRIIAGFSDFEVEHVWSQPD